MQITQAQIRRAVGSVDKERLDEFVASFNQYAIPFGIDTPKRVVHYLAQVFHESGALRYSEEIASGQQYEGRKDLGNTEPGDGKRFKGRAYIQITGRYNYTAFRDSDMCTEDVVHYPMKVAKFPLNQVASMWFWQKHGLNEKADLDNGQNTDEVCKKITKVINGGNNGLSQRLYYLRRFKKEFGV